MRGQRGKRRTKLREGLQNAVRRSRRSRCGRRACVGRLEGVCAVRGARGRSVRGFHITLRCAAAVVADMEIADVEFGGQTAEQYARRMILHLLHVVIREQPNEQEADGVICMRVECTREHRAFSGWCIPKPW